MAEPTAAASPLLHLVPADAWTLLEGRYAPASLTDEGFVHLSAPHQLARVAGVRFAGRDDLLLLVVDPARVDVEIVWEDTAGEGEDFPHAHGSLPRDAVVAVHAYPPAADGHFPPPWEVTDLVPAPDGTPTEAPGTLRFVDTSRAGHTLGHGRLTDLPAVLGLGDLLERRVRAEVAAYDAAPGPTYAGLVQPHDAVRYSDGSRMRTPRHLDVEVFAAALAEALAAGMLHVEAGQQVLTAPTDEVPVADLDEVRVVLQRPVIADDRP